MDLSQVYLILLIRHSDHQTKFSVCQAVGIKQVSWFEAIGSAGGIETSDLTLNMIPADAEFVELRQSQIGD